MAHDIYVGVIRGDQATPAEQVKAARIASLIVGVISIVLGILSKGQNVAHLVGLAFAVAASSNLPAVVMTLYWKRCNTTGVVLGMVIGGLSAIVLVMVSPNMTYPLKVKAEAQKVIDAAPATLEKLQISLSITTDPANQAVIQKEITKVEGDVAKAKSDLEKLGTQTSSLVGLEKPLIELKNPGIISIPLGFLMVILGSLFTRDKRAEEMWDELYVRQNTGIHAEGASPH